MPSLGVAGSPRCFIFPEARLLPAATEVARGLIARHDRDIGEGKMLAAAKRFGDMRTGHDCSFLGLYVASFAGFVYNKPRLARVAERG